MSLITRETFIEQARGLKLPSEECEVPGIGRVRVRGLSVAERTRYEQGISTGKGKDRDVNIRQMREKLLMLCLVTEDGRKLLTEEDMSILSDLPALTTEFLFDKARKLSGMSQEDVDALGNA